MSVPPGKRRTRIPNSPNNAISIWSVIKNAIGKDLTRMPLPVNFFEPLSFLQRLTENLEYASLLDHAANLNDPDEQMLYVAAFTISNYGSSVDRVGKPFNPLLGETFECDRREDLGWISLAEQVSHHPPIAAVYSEGKSWKFRQTCSVTSKFYGTYMIVQPKGPVSIIFNNGNQYTWDKAFTHINGLFVGKPWIYHQGNSTIKCQTSGRESILTYVPYSKSNKDTNRGVHGTVKNDKGIAKWLINGKWDTYVEASKVIDEKSNATGEPTTLWKLNPLPPGNEKFYNFTLLACQMNEPDFSVAPTDSRFRPDQRAMEEGKWDEANQIKELLENKQREARKRLDASKDIPSPKNDEAHNPVWFRKIINPVTKEDDYEFTGEYWACKKRKDWSNCPDIF